MVRVTSYARALTLLPNGQLRLYNMALDTEPFKAGVTTTLFMAGGMTTDNDGMNMGGRSPDARMWDSQCRFPTAGLRLGLNPIKPGEILKTEMAQQGQVQFPWTLFSGNDDAVCLSWTAVTWPDQSAYVWSGDWARVCRRHWYYSGTFLQGTDRKPACQWIDLDGDTPETGFSLHWPSFTMDREKMPTDKIHIERLRQTICNGGAYMSHKEWDPHTASCDPRWEETDIYNDTLWRPDGSRNPATLPKRKGKKKWTDENTKEIGGHMSKGFGYLPPKRPRPQLARRSRQKHLFDSALVVTDDPTHSAEELCDHPDSRGPNLVNIHEGRYCHMVDKSLWPTCSGNTSTNCFDKDARVLMVEGLQERGIPYVNVMDWTGNLNATAHMV
ncbi:hypothetical protein SLS62_003743 [Diatrype stigma]|uniref:Uncharacterized protein n=1 Tax=Diatrype stigma TaxID=117547 RepID=A0AAN9UUE3_9PEZI